MLLVAGSVLINKSSAEYGDFGLLVITCEK